MKEEAGSRSLPIARRSSRNHGVSTCLEAGNWEQVRAGTTNRKLQTIQINTCLPQEALLWGIFYPGMWKPTTLQPGGFSHPENTQGVYMKNNKSKTRTSEFKEAVSDRTSDISNPLPIRKPIGGKLSLLSPGGTN